MRTNSRLRLLAASALLLAGACGPLHRSGPVAYVVFRNESLDQANVYLVRSAGDAIRIGTVTPGRTDSLRVSSAQLGNSTQIQIVARILARSIAPSTGSVALALGESINVTLPPDERILTVLP